MVSPIVKIRYYDIRPQTVETGGECEILISMYAERRGEGRYAFGIRNLSERSISLINPPKCPSGFYWGSYTLAPSETYTSCSSVETSRTDIASFDGKYIAKFHEAGVYTLKLLAGYFDPATNEVVFTDETPVITVNVEETAPPPSVKWKVELSVEKTVVNTGEENRLYAKITNVGNTTGQAIFDLFINGERQYVGRQVYLRPSESTVESWSLVFDTAGKYSVCVEKVGGEGEVV